MESKPNSAIVTIDPTGRIESVSAECQALLGYGPWELQGESVFGLIARNGTGQGEAWRLSDLAVGDRIEIPARHRNGDVIWVDGIVAATREKSGVSPTPGAAVPQGPTWEEYIASELRRFRRDAEKFSRKLKRIVEVNQILLRFLVRKEKAERGWGDTPGKTDIHALVTSYLKKIRKRVQNSQALIYLGIVEHALACEASSFRKSLASQGPTLTRGEVAVAFLVRCGLTSKEIGDVLNISDKTVARHRQHIRRKLGIANRTINLKTYLASMPQG